VLYSWIHCIVQASKRGHAPGRSHGYPATGLGGRHGRSAGGAWGRRGRDWPQTWHTHTALPCPPFYETGFVTLAYLL